MIKDGADFINICHPADRRVISHCLLGRHVARCAQYFLCPCDRAIRFNQARQTKVGQMRFAFLVEQDVSRLDITVKDAVLVGVMNRPRYLGD